MQELQMWIAEDLAKSGLTGEDIEVIPLEPKNKKDGSVIHNGGYQIIYRYGNGEQMLGSNNQPFVRERYRPPLPLDYKGVKKKYGTPSRAGIRIFFPKGVFEYYSDNYDAPLYLTEGEKKAAKATKEGLPCIGLAGIWGWLAPKSERQSTTEKYKINADLQELLHPGREVVIIYDSDSHDSKNKADAFTMNTLQFACELLEHKCTLSRVDVPEESESKNGLDDYLLRHSMDEFKSHIDKTKQAIPEEKALSVRDPYKKITEQEGEPYVIKWNQSNEVSKVALTQGWNARFLMENHRIIFKPQENVFYMYNESNGLWEHKSEDVLKRLLGDELGEYWRKFHGDVLKYLLPSRSDRILKDSINRLRGMVEDSEAFNNPELRKPVIHLADGMLNLETMEMDDFSPEYYSRNQIPISFDENATCPRFLNDLLAPALDDDDIEVVQKYFGMCLLGYNYSQQFLLLEGTPGGGKSTLVDVLRQIIGRKNIAELRTNLLNERFEMAAFGGKTLLIGSDVPGNFLQRSGAEVLKKLTGHDFIEAEFKGGNARTSLTGVFNILITSNNRLRVRLDGDEEAWRRRLLLVKFDNPPVEKKIADFAGILVRDEGKGILNWLINGAKKALADIADGKSIKLPEKLQNDADRLLFESNSVNNFIEECVTVAPGKDVSTFELQNAYVAYCNSNNLMAQPAKSAAMTFAKVMREKFNALNVNNIWRDFHKVHGYRDVALVGIS